MLKKLIGPLAVVSLALTACGGQTENGTEQASSESTASSVTSPNDIISGIVADSDSEPSVGLDFSSGVEWTEERYVATATEGNTITITGYVENADQLFRIQDGEVVEEVPLTETGDFDYTTTFEGDRQVNYFAVDESLEVGQTDVNVDELTRSEKVTFVNE